MKYRKEKRGSTGWLNSYKFFWSKIKAYHKDISLPIRALADSAITSRAIVRYVEVKALLGGTTTGQGIKTQVEAG